MRQITQNIYKFDELSDKVKTKVLDRFRDEVDVTYIYNEVGDTRDTFMDMVKGFEPKENIKGLRLRTYILNNFYNEIFKPKYYSVNFNRDRPIKHNRIDSHYSKYHKHYWFSYHSVCQLEYSCPLTGVIWDFDVLQPIMDLIDYKPENRNHLDTLNWEILILDCLASLVKAEDNEIDYRQSDEALIEFINDLSYEFYENGDVYGHE